MTTLAWASRCCVGTRTRQQHQGTVRRHMDGGWPSSHTMESPARESSRLDESACPYRPRRDDSGEHGRVRSIRAGRPTVPIPAFGGRHRDRPGTAGRSRWPTTRGHTEGRSWLTGIRVRQRCVDDRGNGLFENVSYIQRLDTQGGVAPAGACTDGSQQAVGYSAQYRFYTPTPQPTQ
jgi:hypothetical protein